MILCGRGCLEGLGYSQRIKGHVHAHQTTCLLYLVNAIARMVSDLQGKQESEVGTCKFNKRVTLLYKDDDSHDDVFQPLSEVTDEGVLNVGRTM